MSERPSSAPATFESHEEYKVRQALDWYATAMVGRFTDSARFEEACADRRRNLAYLARDMINLRRGDDRIQFTYMLQEFMLDQWRTDLVPDKCRTAGVNHRDPIISASLEKGFNRMVDMIIIAMSEKIDAIPADLEAEKEARTRLSQLFGDGGGI